MDWTVFQVDESISVLELKKEISKTLSIPVPRQKILFVGRTLADDKPLSAFPQIRSGSKLTVVLKEPEPLKVRNFLLKTAQQRRNPKFDFHDATNYRICVKLNVEKFCDIFSFPIFLQDIMTKIFKKYYSDEQSEAMAKELMIDLDKRLDQLSFDDFERIATYFLERDRKLYGDT